ncbi:hypothetical protein H8A99_13905 [Bradyrhizobium sp. Arg68]|uniref:hypothetical protein n=1 Tax=Bradyrhizobium ivorense TaxID=2511166 RepID=UPI001E4D4CBA|nr:hypothetical protein [Bradyrhizobium ivorense]MCC8937535.1 hypothetical protein [Bradyrhizobium ivorense]
MQVIADPKVAIACVRPMAVVSGYERQKGSGSLAGAETMSLRAYTRRCGAYLALAALMLQLALSFAHVHKRDLAFSGFGRTDGESVRHARPTRQAVTQLPARLADHDDNCPICFSGFVLSNSSLPAAPEGPKPLQFADIDRVLNPVSDRVIKPRHLAFLSRAPPVA